MLRVWPGFSTAGNSAPDIEKPAPRIETELTVRVADPVDVSVKVLDNVVLSATSPKARLLELNVSSGLVAEIPVPLRAIALVVSSAESLDTVMVPLAAPTTAGSNVT